MIIKIIFVCRYGSESSKEKPNITQKDNVPVTPKKRHRDAETNSSEKVNEMSETTDEKTANILEQPRRKKKIVKDLRVTVTKLIPEPGMLEKLEKAEKASASDKNTNSAMSKKSEKITTDKSSKTEKLEITSIDKSTKKDLEIKKSDVESTKSSQNNDKSKLPDIDETKTSITETPSTEAIIKKKKARRRKAINRTGFPSIKKKKKKVATVVKKVEEEMEPELVIPPTGWPVVDEDDC